jgi:hypothetical protein
LIGEVSSGTAFDCDNAAFSDAILAVARFSRSLRGFFVERGMCNSKWDCWVLKPDNSVHSSHGRLNRLAMLLRRRRQNFKCRILEAELTNFWTFGARRLDALRITDIGGRKVVAGLC